MSSKQSGIYKVTSPTNKVYIGQTINLSRRESEYKKIQCKAQPKLFYSLKKHGWEQHKFEIVEYCALEQLNEREVYWKKYFINELGWNKVLFCELYDNGGGPKSESTRKKIGESNKGIPKPRSEETKQKHKQTLKDGGFWWGHKLGGKGTPRIKLKKPVLQYDLQGNFIKEWTSQSDAEMNYSKDRDKDNIGACCRGKQKSAYGYLWKFK